jgi:Mn2+/Fe2+ NRAMP family transporter
MFSIPRLQDQVRKRFRFVGPGLSLAMSSAGWVGLLTLIGLGSDYGYLILWAIMAVLIYKYAFNRGIARYTVSQGENIYAGLRRVPGFRTVETPVIGGIYLIEVMNHGAGAMVAASLLASILPIELPAKLTVILMIAGITAILYHNSYPLFKKIMVVAGVIIVCGLLYNLNTLYFSVPDIAAGFNPDLGNNELLYYIGSIMATLGTGLSLLCYSMWLEKETKGGHGEAFYKEHINLVSFDLTLGFLLLGLLSFFYLTIGFVVMNEEGMSAFENDLMIRLIGHTLNTVPFGMTIFLIISFVTLFVYLIGALDGRARAVATLIAQTINRKDAEDRLYKGIVLVFAALFIIFAFIGDKYLAKELVTLSMIVFGLVGLLLIYLDRTLPPYAQGSWLWYGVMAAGSILFPVAAIYYAMM